jgi:DNA polymerase IV (DinB-like DNA polymerase)
MPARNIILHIDLDAFFASVEERENPHFRGKPIVVGADPKNGQGRGVVSTANYAARKFGVHSAMPISKAYALCPQCVFLPVDGDLYQSVSERVVNIVASYADSCEVVSIDEAYLDVSYCGTFAKAEKLGNKIKGEIFKKEKIHATVGIGPNKMIAKMATNSAKPDGLRVIEAEEVADFLGPLDVGQIPGVGPKSRATCHRLGFDTIAKLRQIPEDFLIHYFGKWGSALYKLSHGIDERPVETSQEVKSIGHEATFEKDTRNSEEIFDTFEGLLKETFSESQEQGFGFRTISIKCRFTGFETHTKDKTFKKQRISFKEYKKTAHILLLEFLLQNKKPIRLIGVRLS